MTELESSSSQQTSTIHKHHLHSAYAHPLTRQWNSSASPITASDLIYPIFLCPQQAYDDYEKQRKDRDSDDATVMNGIPIASMPGQYRWTLQGMLAHLKPLIHPCQQTSSTDSIHNPSPALRAVILFGCPDPDSTDDSGEPMPLKDSIGSGATRSDSLVCQAIRLLKSHFPCLLVICDVCLCAYTSHGHCGIPRLQLNDARPQGKKLIDGCSVAFHPRNTVELDNESSIQQLAQMALAFAKAGADVVAPSDMMDCRIAAIKQCLKEAGLADRTAVMAYSAKFCSGLYGPFRDAAGSAPGPGTDRSAYQLPVGSAGLAMRALTRDVEEGADFIMVKPAGLYGDIIAEAARHFPWHPLVAYQVSGEYAMLYWAAKHGAINLEQAVMESLICLKRAGAKLIISYFTPMVLAMLK